MNKIITTIALLIVISPKIINLFGSGAYLSIFILLSIGFISTFIYILYITFTNTKPHDWNMSWYRRK